MTAKKTIVIVGGGAAGIMTALHLSTEYTVFLIEKEKTLGRKLLVAGKGGFNLTNNIDQDRFVERYTPAHFLDDALNNFTAQHLRTFLKDLGIETFVGSSNRVFPLKGIKPAAILAILTTRLVEKGVSLLLKHELVDLSANELVVVDKLEKKVTIAFDYCVLALGGASWSKTGSNGLWVKLLANLEVETLNFQASNCGVTIKWSQAFIHSHEGKPLKNIQLSIHAVAIKGEALVTSYGLEGNAVYPLIKEVRKELNEGKQPLLKVDLKPNNSVQEILERIKNKAPKEYASALKIGSLELALLKNYTTKEDFLTPAIFSQKIKELIIPITALRPIDEAISTVGGVGQDSINRDFSLKTQPTIYTVGEMVDWDAPTGGFLLQSCFSMAVFVAESINKKL